MRSPDVPMLTRVLSDSRISQRALKTAELPIDEWRNQAGELSLRALSLAERYKDPKLGLDSDINKTPWVDVGTGYVKLAIKKNGEHVGLPMSQVLVRDGSETESVLLNFNRGVITDGNGRFVSFSNARTVIDYIQADLVGKKAA